MTVNSSVKQFGASAGYKAVYGFAAVLFAALCAYRTGLIITARPQTALTVLLFFAAAALFVLIPQLICRRDENAKYTLHTLAAAFFCVYGMTLYIDAQRSLLWLAVYALLVFFIRYALKKESSAKVRAAALVLGLIFAIFVFLGSQLESFGQIEILYVRDEPVTALRMLMCFAGQALLLTLGLNTVFAEILERDFSAEAGTTLGAKRKALKIVLLTAGIMVCFLPYFYAFFPGSLSPDSIYELNMQLGLAELSNHHPYVHQLVIRLALWLGGSVEKGVAVYSLIQMLLLAFSFALCIYFLGSMGANKYIQIGAFCFFALFSVHGFYSVTMWKDVFYGAVCLAFMMLLIAQAKNGGRNIWFAAALALFGFLFCTFRNNGWHAFLLGFPCYILCNRKNWKKLSAVFLIVILLVSAYNHVIFDVLGLRKSASGEALSVPLQQIARTVNKNPDVLKEERFKELREIFAEPDELGDIYISYLADPVKGNGAFLSDIFDKDPVRYLKAWASLGIEHPVTYVEAFLLQNYGYWYPDVTYWIVHNDIEENSLGLELKPERNGMRFELSMLTRDISQQLPTAILYSLGLMVWLMLLAAAVLVLKGQGRLASPIFILAGLWLTTMASPVYCEYRYMYGFVVCVPLFVGLALGAAHIKKNDANELI